MRHCERSVHNAFNHQSTIQIGGVKIAKNEETKTTVKNKMKAKKKPATKAPSKKTAREPAKREKKKAPAMPKEDAGFPIVGIGASAGGLEALEVFFTHMPPDKNIAFVIIQHLSPKHKSIMGSLLSKYTQMDLLDIEDGVKIQPNRIYLNPPDKNVEILNNTLLLMDPIRTGGINLPIDCFFRSMSEDLGEKAICIILSGMATDGSLGLRVIKGGGGMAMVQDPDSAKYDGMPSSAIDTGLVDFILPVEKIPAQLLKYVRSPYIDVPEKVKSADDPFENHIHKIFILIRSATGHDFSHYKQTTLLRRIERRMAVHQIHQISDYVKYLQYTPVEVDILFKDMLIGVTRFFRDLDAFQLLEEQMNLLLKSRPPEVAIRIWTVGCSTGEEVYSLAILLLEAMERSKYHFNVQFFASDIDSEAIDRARRGVYPDSIAAHVSQERLRRYFIKEENTFQIKKQVREMIVFAVHNIAKDPPFSKIDLLSCRNLLIYMDGALQKKVLPLCHYALNPQGILFLGPSESIGEFSDLFQTLSRKWNIFKRKDLFTEKSPDYPDMPFYHGPSLETYDEKRPPAELDLHQMAERVILDHFSPSGVLVNDKYEIIHFMGKTDKYLETPTGQASFNILKMAREGLKLKLGAALHNAARQKKTIVHEALRIRYNGTYRLIDLTVRPLLEANLKEDFMLVMFVDKMPPEKQGTQKRKETGEDDVDPRVTRLEEELKSTKEYLQTTIDEKETSNEELKSTNEEIQSVNEEIQSSKEELQSTNEELITVNTELQSKVNELSSANDDINNLLAVIDIGTIFLDTGLCIKRYTPAAKRIFNLIPTDVGRPISHITAKIDYANLVEDAQQVLNTLVQKEREIETKDGVCYAMRMMPYRTTLNVIDGLVITFVDVTRMKEWEMGIQRLATVVMDSNDAIMLMDFEGKITAWNKGAEKMYGYTEKKALTMNVKELVPRDKVDEMKAIAKKLKSGESVDSVETQRITAGGELLDVWLTVTGLTDSDGTPLAIATTGRNITGWKRS